MFNVQVLLALIFVLTRALRNLQRSYYAKYWLTTRTPKKSSSSNKVVVIVCCYKRVHSECLQSIARQKYAGELTVYIVDDGSPNYKELWDNYYHKFSTLANWHLIVKKRENKNNGKKKAQQTALETHKNWNDDDLILFLDADTYLRDDHLIQQLADTHADERIGAVAARLGVSNSSATWLTNYLTKEYTQTFLQTKAAQSSHGMVLVINGACSMWKHSAIKVVYDRYLQGPATGDENTLTWEVLTENYQTVMIPAVANTEVPEKLWDLIIQQLRWLRSDCLYILKTFRLLTQQKKKGICCSIGWSNSPLHCCCLLQQSVVLVT
jgi:N-acetylglucosaminyltransferase